MGKVYTLISPFKPFLPGVTFSYVNTHQLTVIVMLIHKGAATEWKFIKYNCLWPTCIYIPLNAEKSHCINSAGHLHIPAKMLSIRYPSTEGWRVVTLTLQLICSPLLKMLFMLIFDSRKNKSHYLIYLLCSQDKNSQFLLLSCDSSGHFCRKSSHNYCNSILQCSFSAGNWPLISNEVQLSSETWKRVWTTADAQLISIWLKNYHLSLMKWLDRVMNFSFCLTSSQVIWISDFQFLEGSCSSFQLLNAHLWLCGGMPTELNVFVNGASYLMIKYSLLSFLPLEYLQYITWLRYTHDRHAHSVELLQQV